MTVERFWGEECDRAAVEQLGLTGDHTIMIMANEIDYLHDEDLIETHVTNRDLCYADYLWDEIKRNTVHVPVPKGFALVGLYPIVEGEINTDGLPKYGFVALPGRDTK